MMSKHCSRDVFIQTGKVLLDDKVVAAKKLKDSTKADRLIALLRKPNGAQVSVIIRKLDWQPHTVRAAISGLRKKGLNIASRKSKLGGETVYLILPDNGTLTKPIGERGAN